MFEVNVSGRWLPLTGIHRSRVSAGYFFRVRAYVQGIRRGQEAHQEKYFNDRYQENPIVYQQTLFTHTSPKYYNVELYNILITYSPKVQ